MKQIIEFFEEEEGKYVLKLQAAPIPAGEAKEIQERLEHLEEEVKGVKVWFENIEADCIRATIEGQYFHAFGALKILQGEDWAIE